MIELFRAGDPVPRSWFKRLVGVKSAIFLHPCIVKTTDGHRHITKAAPRLDGPLVLFTPTTGNGEMKADFDMPTVVVVGS